MICLARTSHTLVMPLKSFSKTSLWGLLIYCCCFISLGIRAIPVSSSLQPALTEYGLPSPTIVAVPDGSSLRSRTHGYQHLGQGWHLYYKTFLPFDTSWGVALRLSMFWSEIAIQVSNRAWMPDDQFLDHSFMLHMPLGAGATYGAAHLVFEVISLEGPVSRELVAQIAAAMMEYTLRGFCGLFNAWLTRGRPGDGIWIVLRLKGRSEIQALMPSLLEAVNTKVR